MVVLTLPFVWVWINYDPCETDYVLFLWSVLLFFSEIPVEFSHRCDPVFQKSVWIQQLVAHIVGTHLMPQLFSCGG